MTPIDRAVKKVQADAALFKRIIACLDIVEAEQERIAQYGREGYDIHTAVAAVIFKVKPGEVTLEQRRAGRACSYAIVWGVDRKITPKEFIQRALEAA